MDDNEKKKLAGALAMKMQAMLDAASTGEDEKLHEAMTDAMKTAKSTVDEIAADPTSTTDDSTVIATDNTNDDSKTSENTTSAIMDSNDEQAESNELEDLSSIIHSKAHGLLDSIRKGWADYTSDVREEDEDKPESVTTITDDTTTSAKPSTQDKPAQATAPVSISPVKIVNRISQISESFLNGILGRPQQTYDNRGNKKSTSKIVFNALTGVFAVLGLIAVVRATMDAFKPRR